MSLHDTQNAADFAIVVLAFGSGRSLERRRATVVQQRLSNLPFDPKDDNRLGPNLHQIIGRKAGSLPEYNYSAAMRDSDFIWDEAKLARFIANPDEVVPGNKMAPYGGLASVEGRKKILLFLQSMRSQ